MHHHLLLEAELDHPLGCGPPAYQALVEAVDRLLNNEPENPDVLGRLDELRSQHGEDARVPLNIETVVLEAGRDRKALVGKNPRYRKLSNFIRTVKPTHGVSETTTRLIERLQSEAREWKQRERVLRSKLAEKEIQLSTARRNLIEAQNEARRWRGKKS